MADKFDTAAQIVQSLPKDGPVQPTVEDKLLFYGWYKSVTVGAVDHTRPRLMDFEGKAKWDAWNAAQTTPTNECKRLYVQKLIAILEASDSEEAKKYLAQLK